MLHPTGKFSLRSKNCKILVRLPFYPLMHIHVTSEPNAVTTSCHFVPAALCHQGFRSMWYFVENAGGDQCIIELCYGTGTIRRLSS